MIFVYYSQLKLVGKLDIDPRKRSLLYLVIKILNDIIREYFQHGKILPVRQNFLEFISPLRMWTALDVILGSYLQRRNDLGNSEEYFPECQNRSLRYFNNAFNNSFCSAPQTKAYRNISTSIFNKKWPMKYIRAFALCT